MNIVRTFQQFLAEQRGGKLHDELTEALRQVTESCQGTERKAKLILEITVEPFKNATGGVVTITDEVKLKLPSIERDSSLFFVTPEGNLTRDMPQRELPGVRSVERQEEKAHG